MNRWQRQYNISPLQNLARTAPSVDGPLVFARRRMSAESVPGHWYKKILLTAIALAVSICLGCGHLKAPSETDIVSPTQSPEAYITFWSENKRYIDMIYDDDYMPYPIIVDTAFGSRDILSLIDPETARPLVIQFMSNGAPPDLVVQRSHRFVLSQFRYVQAPDVWPTIEQTLEQRSGDCKGLSLLLMSMLIAAGIDASAEISNGHMWIRVNLSGTTSILETDQSPERRIIYESPGFYDRPLLKIVPNQTYRRKRKG